MEKEINVGALELEKGAESIKGALDDILKDAKDKAHLITFTFNHETAWYKIDLSKPGDAQVIYFNESHRSMLRPLHAIFQEFLSRFPKGNLLDWDKHNRVEHSVHETPFPNAISKEFVEKCPRIDEARYRELAVVSTSQSRFGMGMFERKPNTQTMPSIDEKEEKKPGPQGS